MNYAVFRQRGPPTAAPCATRSTTSRATYAHLRAPCRGTGRRSRPAASQRRDRVPAQAVAVGAGGVAWCRGPDPSSAPRRRRPDPGSAFANSHPGSHDTTEAYGHRRLRLTTRHQSRRYRTRRPGDYRRPYRIRRRRRSVLAPDGDDSRQRRGFGARCRPQRQAPDPWIGAAIWPRFLPSHLRGATSDLGRRRSRPVFGLEHVVGVTASRSSLPLLSSGLRSGGIRSGTLLTERPAATFCSAGVLAFEDAARCAFSRAILGCSAVPSTPARSSRTWS